MTPEIVNNTKCWWEKEYVDGDRFTYTEVRLKHLANQHPLALILQVSPLYLACEYGETEFALILLRAGASPDSLARWSDGRLRTPLYIAVVHPNIRDKEKLVRALIDAGATVGLGVGAFEWRDEMEPGVAKMVTGVTFDSKNE